MCVHACICRIQCGDYRLQKRSLDHVGRWRKRQNCKQIFNQVLARILPSYNVLIQRPLWRHYYQNTDVLIYVIDSNDRERISECQEELQRFLCEDELKDSILLVLANKQDLPNAMNVQEITEKLGLNALRNRQWCKCAHIQWNLLAVY